MAAKNTERTFVLSRAAAGPADDGQPLRPRARSIPPVDHCPFPLLIAVLGGWLHREQADVIAFLREENRLLGSPDGACVSTTVSTDASPNWDTASVAG